MNRHTLVLVHTFKLPDKHFLKPDFADTFYHAVGSALCDVLYGGGFWHMAESGDYVRHLSQWLEELEPAWERHVREGIARLVGDVAFTIIKRHEDELDYILSDNVSVNTIDYRLCNGFVKVRINAWLPV